MRDLESGQSFIITRNGEPVAQRRPFPRYMFTDRASVVAAFANVPPIDAGQFRRDVDEILDQDMTAPDDRDIFPITQ